MEERKTHRYNTRSKNNKKRKYRRKRNDDSSSDEYENDIDDDDDVDSYGNIKGLIDYDYPDSKNVMRKYKSKSRYDKYDRHDKYDKYDKYDYKNEKYSNSSSLMNQLLLVNALQMLSNKKMSNKYDNEYMDEESFSDMSSENEYTYEEQKYMKSISSKRKKRFKKKEKEIQNYNKSIVPLRFKILDLPLSVSSKAAVMMKYNSFANMEETDNEYHKLNTWFSEFNNIPFHSTIKFPLKVTSQSSVICEFLTNSRKILDETIYGHELVKDTIIQILSQWLTNPCSKGTVLALQGPMGNGKTTLVKKGLSKVLHRPFALVALGGAKDSSFLQGHEYTYEGAKCGKIIEILQYTKCMNPIIFFDELDKLSKTANGSEISNLLCHITDPVQNNSFHDRYFSGIDFDISKCVFIMSFNDETKIDSILKDRLNIIRMKGYTKEDKIQIAQKHLIPDI